MAAPLRLAAVSLVALAACEMGEPVVGGVFDATVDHGPDATVDHGPEVTTPDAAPPDAPADVARADAADGASPLDAAPDAAPDVMPDAAPDAAPDVVDAPPPGCGADGDCAGDPAGPVCDAATRRCVRCLGARGCATGRLCCDGACVDPATTAAHCGACGRVCMLPNATSTCAMGACAVGACAAGFGDCDGMHPNGCEVPLATTASHCGACGRACMLPNATATCAMGTCTVGACAAGFADCDTNPANGCEANVASDAARCGACGTRCAAGQSCVAGRCASDCRNGGAIPCASPLVCDFLTGQCLDPARACVLSGTPVDCGTEAMPQSCGPGSRCDTATRRCVAAAECRRVVCDATGLCRGADCMLGGGGGVRSLTLDDPMVGAAGATGGIRLRATVDAESLCGLNVGFEVRREDGYYLSAGNDMGVWRVSTAGARTMHLPRIGGVSGLAADRTGALYYVISRTGSVHRVTDVGGAVRDVEFARLTTGGRGVSRMSFGPDGQLYVANRTVVTRLDEMGRASTVITLPAGAQDITGLTFDGDGALHMLTIASGIYRLPVGATAATVTVVPHTALAVADFFGEALVVGPDGLLYGSSFPNSNTLGLVFRVEAGPRVTRFIALADMQRDVSAVRFAGVHGLAFGADASLYFVNQNTSGDTREAVGQLLVRRPTGRIELVASGFNFDWPDGYDGDLVVAFVTLDQASGAVVAGGEARASLDVPMTPGTYELRAFVTDPRTGAIRVVRRPITVR